MNKGELVKKTKEILNLSSERAAADVIDGFTKVMLEVLSSGEEISLSGFGKFVTSIRDEHKCRNPKTGEEVVVPKKRVLHFKPSISAKQRINENINK